MTDNENQPQVEVYTTDSCPFCEKLKTLLSKKNIPYIERNMTSDPNRKALTDRTFGIRAVPQVFSKGEYIGDYTHLQQLENTGRLDAALGVHS